VSSSKPATKTSSVATSATRTASASATPTGLQDWVVNSVSSFSPGERAVPWLTITASVTDPNAYTLTGSDGNTATIPGGSQGLNCKAMWYAGESPVGRTWPCDASDGSQGWWLMHVVDDSGAASTEDFKLTFTHQLQTMSAGSILSATYEATGTFAVGGTMSGSCGGSGVCGWSLKQPLNITPKKD